MNIRNKVFCLLKRENIVKYVEELKYAERSSDFYDKQKNSNIERFFHEISLVPYYKEYAGRNLNEFPVMQKAYIQKNLDLFLNPKYKDEKLITLHTSGSYGLPSKFYVTQEKKQKQLAEVIYFGKKVGYDVGVKHMYIRSVVHKSKFKQFVQNEWYLGAKNLDESFFSRARDLLIKKKIKVIIGFPTAIHRIAEYCHKRGDKPSDFCVEGIITSSENLTSVQRELFEKVWNCKVCSRYSTEEFGVLANQYEKDGKFCLNSLNYIVEILDLNSDKPAKPGDIGRLVVTDLHSFAMPLIRYDTGDLAKLDDNIKVDSFGHLTEFGMLSGRAMQIITTTSGESRYPLYFDSIMEKYPAIVQYQLIQETNDQYRCLVVCDIIDNAMYSTILKDLQDWVGSDANISVEKVEEIEKLPSGKRPYIINRTL
ncbi:hypothetical protein IX332_000737 [Porphyromonas levii]|uniref:phenylacetate--CoA ligase family protein n=1 Tax=Porphyromonas levii TaxID=28114 RepID=UPI001B8D3858|nr:phenylacetate--CoA ligase family protein [Porphyromonas levii]MBR8729417.1 hypothetical protein [Porphyromonas levii]MBR8784445.1 hypothetical protein [Porphyromonas levii]